MNDATWIGLKDSSQKQKLQVNSWQSTLIVTDREICTIDVVY